MEPLLTTPLSDRPLWMWLSFAAIIIGLLLFDLGVFHRRSRIMTAKESLLLSAIYIMLGISFGGFVWSNLGQEAGIEYITGFVVEKSLALDNVFVISLIFTYFFIPKEYQHRVLFTGIIGVIVLRGIMIGFGTTLVSRFDWILYIFAVFLIVTGAKMLWWAGEPPDLSKNPVLKLLQRRFRVTDNLHGERFFVRLPEPRTGTKVVYLTPLFVALILIEVTDAIFAVDSIPAIFAITTDTYVVYTSNIFAILGLRALYFALAEILHRFSYLNRALAVLLIFIGSKIFVADFFNWSKFPAEWSLGITFAILGAGMIYSAWRTRHLTDATGRM